MKFMQCAMYCDKVEWTPRLISKHNKSGVVQNEFIIVACMFFINTIPLGTESRVSPKLVNNMSSRVPGPSLGHLFPKLEYWGPFEALAEKCENTIYISKNPLHG